MTDDERARALVQSIIAIYPSIVGIIGPDYEPGQRLVAAIAAYGREERRRADDELWNSKEITALMRMTPTRHHAITWDNGVEILNHIQDVLIPFLIARCQQQAREEET